MTAVSTANLKRVLQDTLELIELEETNTPSDMQEHLARLAAMRTRTEQALAALENPSVHTHEGWLLVGTLHGEVTYGEWFPSWETLVAAFNEQTGHRYADAEDPVEAYDNDEDPDVEAVYNIMPLTLKLPVDNGRQHEATVIEAVLRELREH